MDEVSVPPERPLPNLQETKLAVNGPPSAEQSRDPYEPSSESSPLLKVQVGDTSGDGRRCGDWNWKNIIATVILWLMYLFVSAAYSIIGPFFPSEVSLSAIWGIDPPPSFTFHFHLLSYKNSLPYVILHTIFCTG